MSANGSLLLIFLPTGAGKISARDALDRQRGCLPDDHGTTGELLLEGLKVVGEQAKMRGDEVIWNKVELVEPERGNLGENFAFVRNRVGQDAVEGGDAIRRDEQKVFAKVKDFAHLSAAEFRNSWKIAGEKIHDAA